MSSAGEVHHDLRSPRQRHHELKRHRRTLSVAWLGSALVIGLMLWLLDSYIVTPQVVIDGGASSMANEYQRTATSYFDAHPLQRFRFMLSSDGLNVALQRAHPEIDASVVSNMPGLAAHRLTIQLRTAIIRWQLGDAQYFVDQRGVMFQQATGPIPSLVVTDESGLSAATQQIASRRMLQSIGQIVGQISSQGLGSIDKVVIPVGTLREVDISLKGRAYRLKMSIDRDARQQVSDAGNALRYIDDHALSPRYIDVRVEGKAFYLE